MANPLAALFGGHTPFKGLQDHMRVVHACALEVTPLIEALVAGDQAAVEAQTRKINDLEGQADVLKNELRSHLPRSLFMPVDRRDFLEVLHLQDSIADTAQDIAGLLTERTFVVPEVMAVPLVALTRRCVDVVELAHQLIETLDELIAVGFRGRVAGRVEELARSINKAEDDTDELGIQLARTLFSLEGELSAVSVMLWYQQIQWIGDLADHAEKMANRLRLIIAS